MKNSIVISSTPKQLEKLVSMLKESSGQILEPNLGKYPWRIVLPMTGEQVKIWDKFIES